MLQFIDTFLNKVTMYRLTLYYLIALVVIAMVGGLLHVLPYSPRDILIQVTIAVIVSLITNFLFAKFFHAVTNVESVYITALILVLIIPVTFPKAVPFIALAAFVAMAGKYLATIDKRHIFNPAAASVLAISLLSPEHSAIWWVGTNFMAPFVIIGGLLVMRKIQRERMVITFFVTYFVILAGAAVLHEGTIAAIFSQWQKSVLESSLLFFGFVMFTEPLTSPATKKLQEWYAYIVAALFVSPQVRLLNFTLTPEMALCIGNIFSYIISPNYRLVLPLSWKKYIGNVGVFAFEIEKSLAYIPGQYMEWTLPHAHVDSRGNRRYFSIGSSPTEKELLLAVKFYSPSSSYKTKLHTLEKGDEIIAAQVAGDFTLPKKINIPLVFIAGGVGIVPFRSMVKYIIDKKLQADIIILYTERNENDFVFKDIFKEAEKYGVQTTYLLSDYRQADSEQSASHRKGEKGYITEEMVKGHIPDFKNRIFYLSGPQLMVERYARLLKSMGLSGKKIKQDFFPGYQEK